MRTAKRHVAKIALAILSGAFTILLTVGEAVADISPKDKEVLEAVEKVAPSVEEIGQKLWDLSESSLLEVESSKYLKDILKKNGFGITSEGTAGVSPSYEA